MDFMRLVSLKSRYVFFLLVGALSFFSVGSWWSVRMLVGSEVEARLKADENRLETVLESRLEAQASNLRHLRAMLAGGPVNQEILRAAARKMDGSLGRARPEEFGFARVEGDPSSFTARVRVHVPEGWPGVNRLGFDLSTLPGFRGSLRKALGSGEVAMVSGAFLPSENNRELGPAFLFFVPVFSDDKAGPVAASAFPRLRGVAYTAVSARTLFASALGAPSLRGESVNFILEDPLAGPLPLYNRFEESPGDNLWAVERVVQVMGKELLLRVYPLPSFFSFGDRYLAILVGLGAAFVSCMILVVMRVSQNQLDFEILAKEASMEVARESRKQVDNLRQLNEFERALVGELDTDVLLSKFSGLLGRLAELDASFVFFKSSARNTFLDLKFAAGIEEKEFRSRVITDSWLEKIVTQSLVLRKGSAGSDEILHSVLGETGKFSDWFLFIVSTREGGKCGLVFVARSDRLKFSEVEKEMLESVVTQFANSSEIAQLFLRVEDANKAKNAFLANMSHEIRTPLSAIVGFSEIMAGEDTSPAQKAALAENLRRNGRQLTCIIDDILDLSKVEAGKLRIEKKIISLPSIMHEVRSVMAMRAKNKGVAFSIEASGKVPVRIETDEVRLKQILMNLVGNAIKFTEKGDVRVVVRHLFGENRNNCLAFTVKDTGIGIPDESQESLFLPFSQVDMSSTRKFGGSGLGLALSRRLAQELGGDVDLVESIRGQGSTFELRIEVGDLAETPWIDKLFPRLVKAPAPPPAGSAPRLDGAKILVVEDSEDNQDIFRYFLESYGASAKIVENGDEAVKTASRENFDLILMDIQIPGIDGKEATRRIRKLGFKRPIVALTAHAMPEEQESCLKAGCVGQITKPVSGEALVQQVAGYLRGA
jgi:signal transduction histidine kinase/CheY-like chemotaxis protein